MGEIDNLIFQTFPRVFVRLCHKNLRNLSMSNWRVNTTYRKNQSLNKIFLKFGYTGMGSVSRKYIQAV